MRRFTFGGPCGLNGYAEIPSFAPVDYTDECYIDISVWGGLTFEGYGLIVDDKLIEIYSGDSHFKSNGKLVTEESLHEQMRGRQLDNYEIIKIVGFDDAHIVKFSGNIECESEMLASQIDDLFNPKLTEEK